MNTIKNAEELKLLFGLDMSDEYIEYTALKDVPAGFSIKREYPQKIRFKPPVNKKGEPDALAMIHVLYQESKEKDAVKDPIILHITTFNRYRSKYYDYNFEDSECPTEVSIQASRNTPKPLDLENNDSYFFDKTTGKLVNADGKIVEGISILKELYDKHCETVHALKGLPLRTRIKTSRLLANLFDKLGNSIEYLLRVVWNREIEKGDRTYFGIHKIKPGELKLSSIDSIVIFGYKISERIAVLFSAIVLLFYTIIYFIGIRSNYIKAIFSNVLLTTCSVIIGLYILNNFTPNYFILTFLNLCRRLKWYFLWKKHKA